MERNDIANHRVLGILAALLMCGTTRPARASTDDQQRLKEFVVMGYQGIVSDLSVGQGPYLLTLFDLTKTPANERAKAFEKIQILSKTYPNIMDFADQIVLLAPAGPVTTPDASRSPVVMPVPTGPTVYSGDRLLNALDHLTRGMKVTVYTNAAEPFNGYVENYDAHRLWVRGTSRKSFPSDRILALDAPDL
jgi:hypothetical protein